jgi:hypothetical protein
MRNMEKMTVNPHDQTTQKSRNADVVQIEITRETFGKLQGLETIVHEILGKKKRVSHDTMIRLLMEIYHVDNILTDIILGRF